MRRTAPAEPPALLDLMQATARRDDGLSRAEAHSDIFWAVAADEAIRKLAASGEAFTADQVRELAGNPPGHFNAMGARLAAAAKAGVIRQVGFAYSARPQGHKNLVRAWSGR